MFHLYNTLPPWFKKKKEGILLNKVSVQNLCTVFFFCVFITQDFRFTWNLVLMASQLVLCPTYSAAPASTATAASATTTTTTFMANILAGYNSCSLATSSVPSVCLSSLSHILLLPALLINTCYVCSCLIWQSSDRTVPITNICDCVALVVGRDSLHLRKTVLKVPVKWTWITC